MLNALTRKLLGMLGTTLICKSTFPIVNFMKTEYRSGISDEHLMSELSCAESAKYTLDFEEKRAKKNSLTFLITLFINILK